MASLPDMVTRLVADTSNFQRGMTSAQQTINKFATATLAIGGVAAVGLVKLAADAETMAVKFKVLLKSGTAAAAMIGEISDLAASTPFQKMDIAGAAQKLLAFNVPADQVISTIRNIGDISALTGNSITEMAELYGKANVQGRLFAEDINQLTGRGIPIIQELEKQFPNTEKSMRQLVEAGEIHASHLKVAFESMTGAGGQFADGMEQLSKTTTGQFSTLKDNVVELGAAMGKELLPRANELMATMLAVVQATEGWGPALIDTGIALVSAAVAIKALNIALALYAKRAAIALSLSGPAGWATLAVGLAAAAAAMWAMADGAEAVRVEAEGWPVVHEGAAAAEKLAAQNRAAAEAMREAAAAADELAAALAKKKFDQELEELDQLKAAMQGLRTPAEVAEQELQKFHKLVMKFVAPADQQNVLNQFIDQQTGFSDAMANARDELAKLQGTLTDTDIIIRDMAELGAGTDQLAELRGVLDAIDAAEAAKEKTEKKKRPMQFAGIMQKGSAEAFTTIVKAMGGRQDPSVKAITKVEKAVKEGTKETKKVWKATNDFFGGKWVEQAAV